MKVTTVRDVMTKLVVVLQVGNSLERAARLMGVGRIRHLPVVDEENRVIGLVTHRKLLAAWVSHGDPNHERLHDLAKEIPVEMLMESDVLTIGPDESAAKAAALLVSRKFGCLPVVEEDRLVGIVTEADFVRFAQRYLEREETASRTSGGGTLEPRAPRE
jgi:CBS domain-containing membrane protein